MSYITFQWVKMNPSEAAALLIELERENASLKKIVEAASDLIDYSEAGSADKWSEWDAKFDALSDLINLTRKS